VVHVRLFASLRDAAGWSERLVPLPPAADQGPCTPALLWPLLALDVPFPSATARSLPPGLRVAINQRFAGADTPLEPGDELAFLPPITGG
jgi:molybdopterin synthase sulfur carrier subunit